MKKLNFALIDVPASGTTAPQVESILKTAALLARPRKTPGRKRLGKRMKIYGLAAPEESWRDLTRRWLRRHLPLWATVYTGGSHLAIHTFDVGTGLMKPECLGRIVEVRK